MGVQRQLYVCRHILGPRLGRSIILPVTCDLLQYMRQPGRVHWRAPFRAQHDATHVCTCWVLVPHTRMCVWKRSAHAQASTAPAPGLGCTPHLRYPPPTAWPHPHPAHLLHASCCHYVPQYHHPLRSLPMHLPQGVVPHALVQMVERYPPLLARQRALGIPESRDKSC